MSLTSSYRIPSISPSSAAIGLARGRTWAGDFQSSPAQATLPGAILSTLNALGVSVLVFDESIRLQHVTDAGSVLLARDGEAAVITDACARLARSTRLGAARDALTTAASDQSNADLRTSTTRYRLRACIQHSSPSEATKYVLVALERLTSVPVSEEQLRLRFALTAAEARVTLLLADGLSNQEIALRLAISQSTARRHTERVFDKMGVKARSRVGAMLAMSA